MKTKDLMIGDWVRITKSQWHEGSIQKVLDIYENGSIRTKHISPVLKDSYEPIPLTPEILEKNGWKPLLNYDRETYYSADGAFNLLVYNGKLRLIVHSHTVILEYIHQLQHALRLCGLTELADNFKIE